MGVGFRPLWGRQGLKAPKANTAPGPKHGQQWPFLSSL